MLTKRRKNVKKTSPVKTKSHPSLVPCLTARITSEDLKVHPVLKNYFGYCLYKAAMRLKMLMDERISAHGITTTQLGMLRILSDMGDMSQNTLGSGMGIDKASMAKWIEQLDHKKLVTRTEHAEDRRIKTVSITRKGSQLIQRLVEIRRKAEAEFLSKLTLEEQAVIRAAIPKLLT